MSFADIIIIVLEKQKLCFFNFGTFNISHIKIISFALPAELVDRTRKHSKQLFKIKYFLFSHMQRTYSIYFKLITYPLLNKAKHPTTQTF